MRPIALILAAAAFIGGKQTRGDGVAPVAPKVPNAIHFAAPERVAGLLGERLDLWRRVRLWRVANDPFLLEGFEHRPGKHPWQGEHVGKWLHAASLAEAATGDKQLDEKIREVAARLIATQEPNGYLGTYAPQERFYEKLSTGDPTTWDVWTQRYVIYGLLAYYDLHHDPAALEACKKAGDLLLQCFGPPDGDVTRFGTRQGLSAAVLLESIVLLYEHTGDQRYLDFAMHITTCIEKNPGLRIAAAMRGGEDVTVCGDGKAYQLMSVLLGYVELYRVTGDKDYLQTAVNAWARISAEHINLAGGPWSYQAKATTNQECFAPVECFHPTNCIETCSTTTWIQLSLALFELTGEARYADAAETAVFNQLLGAQSPNGNDWAYHSMLNMPARGYEDQITCCASSGPRALELYARDLVGSTVDGLVINSYAPSAVTFDHKAGGAGRVVIEGDYPLAAEATIRLKLAKPATFVIDFRLPARAKSLAVEVDGARQPVEQAANGFYRLRREWKSADAISVKFDFPLRASFQTASDGLRWAGFSWGPLALAQSLVAQTDQPQNVLAIEKESPDGSQWLEPLHAVKKKAVQTSDASEELDTRKSADGVAKNTALPSWRLKTPRKAILAPYHQAGGATAGVRTMFPTRQPVGAAPATSPVTKSSP
jgi:DUF1680 family protein